MSRGHHQGRCVLIFGRRAGPAAPAHPARWRPAPLWLRRRGQPDALHRPAGRGHALPVQRAGSARGPHRRAGPQPALRLRCGSAPRDCGATALQQAGFAKDMLGYKHSGFSVDAGVCIEAHDRAGAPSTHPPAPLLWCAGTKLAAESGGNGAGSACCVATSLGGDFTTWRGRTWGGGAGQRGHTHTRT